MIVDPKTGKPHLEFFRIDDDGFVEIAPGIFQRMLANGMDEARKHGHLNRLVRWAPHAALMEVKVHDFYEEVFVAQGEFLVASQEDPSRWDSFPAFSFACRPPHAPHGPFRAGPDGCVLFESQFYL